MSRAAEPGGAVTGVSPRGPGYGGAVPELPSARGPISAFVVDALRRPPHALAPPDRPGAGDGLADDDLQLALYVCYELHYRGFDAVDERWEWEPSLLALRATLEAEFERALDAAVPPVDPGELPAADRRPRPESGPPPPAPPPPVAPGELPAADQMDVALRAIADADDGPSLSRHLERDGTLEQFLEFCVHRSAYQLKEADPPSWALPRLGGAPKAAMVEIQADEYGGGRADRIHAELFARSLRALGLEDTYGAYLDVIPGVTLATVNLMSLAGLHRRRRGAIVGHLALFEMTSSVPNRRYANALRRFGPGGDATGFFHEHLGAGAGPENIAGGRPPRGAR